MEMLKASHWDSLLTHILLLESRNHKISVPGPASVSTKNVMFSPGVAIRSSAGIIVTIPTGETIKIRFINQRHSYLLTHPHQLQQ